jgi:small subunit ribosomal protein S18
MPLIKRKIVARKTDCPYCKNSKEPDYKETEELKIYMSDRGRIYARARTALCAKHQRRVAIQIKKARHLGLLPFVTKV